MSKTITITGNLADDPELTFTTGGKAVCKFRVLVNERYFNRDTNQWDDGETVGFNVDLWEQAAENAAESLIRGMAVIVHGEFKQQNWTNDQGEKKSRQYIRPSSFGPDLTRATAKVTKATAARQTQPDKQDPWGTPAEGDTPPF